MIIRREHSGDTGAIHQLHTTAFATAPHTSGTEADLVDALRADIAWIPQLSLVATQDGTVIAHAVCTRAHIADLHPALGLGPIAVAPDRQHHGIGTQLMHALLAAAEARDETTVCLLGEPDYYRRFGFEPAATHHITAPDPAWGDYFQVRTLTGHHRDITGPFRYATPFDQA